MSVNLNAILLQAQGASNPYFSLLFMGGMVVVMYFFMIRPQSKRAKEQKLFAANITAGEKIVTTSGIHAVINRVNDDNTLQIEVSRGNFMIVDRSAVSMEMTNAMKKRSEGAAGTAVAAK